ncbi:MAG: PspC domain-containing protein [Cytophagaceae bacterium]|nr:PspC domain-containing protein [Cytophagaceae bacterium]
MKKTFSITISGVVFHIEEDGYERLRSYLASVQQYFSAYEGSTEIIADIEGRIAEKFADKLQKEDKQALSATDVDDLVRSMGTVADFEAIEEEEDLQALHARQQAQQAGGAQTAGVPAAGAPVAAVVPPVATGTAPRRLYRDTKRKLLGGVAAGIAHYFNSDPLWVRLIFLVLALAVPGWFDGPFDNDSMNFFGPVSGFTFLIYIALWVSLPANLNLEEDEKIKKLYRDPDQKVVGGVVAGVAKYTGWDLGLLRFLFVISVFLFGTGIILYLILWAITPEAKTLTDKMQMTGEPITLENIETNVKRGLNVENQAESGLTKALLFPFRALAAIFTALGPLFNFLLVAIRVFAGLLLIVIGASAIIALFVILISGLGLLGTAPVFLGDGIPAYMLSDVSPWLFVFGFLAAGIPFLALAIAGSSLLVRRNLFNARLGLPLLALWIFGTVGAVAMGTSYAANYQRGGEVEKVVTFPAATVAQLDAEDNDDESWNRTRLTLEPYDGTDLQLVQTFEGRGRTREDAKANAASLVYNVVRKDSTLIFDERAELATGRPFRGQELNMVLRVPYGKSFRMTRNFADFVTNQFNRELFDTEKGDQFRTVLFQFSKEKGELICLNCQGSVLDTGDDSSYDFNDEDDSDDGIDMGRGEFSREEKVAGFQKLEISGNFYVEVKQGTAYRVELDGNRRDVQDVRVRTDGDALNIGYGDGFRINRRKRVNVRITMPSLSGVEFMGATRAEVKGFNQNTDLDVQLTGASTAVFTSLNAQTIDAEVSGAARLTLVGNAQTLKADISGASQLKAASLKTAEADVDASGASSAQVFVEKKLQATATGASHIGYKGSATDVNKSTSGGSSVDREEGEENVQ